MIIMKEFQIIKGPWKVDNPNTSKVDKPFCKSTIGVENKDPRMYV